MLHILVRGGWMMIPIALCSFVAVAVIIERLCFFVRIGAPDRAEEVIALARKGRIEEAAGLAHRIIDEGNKSASPPVMRVLSAGLDHPLSPADAMQAAGAAEVSSMKRNLAALDTIITLSPLLGLLGTIIGMINAFNVMAAAGLGQPHAVTGGVAEALVCTAAGISVAIITLIPYNHFLARVERGTDVIETYATRLEPAMIGCNRGEKR